jgi:hypothetical protein
MNSSTLDYRGTARSSRSLWWNSHRKISSGWYWYKILAILDKSPFESACSIAEILHVAHSTILLHLYDYIGFRSFHLHWVSHLLMHDLCEKRIEYAQAMLFVLHAAERDDWNHLVIGDESWFVLNISPRYMWTLSRDDVITKPRLDIQSENSCLRSCGIRGPSMLLTSF